MGQGPPRAKADLVSGGPVVWSGEGLGFKSLFDLSIFRCIIQTSPTPGREVSAVPKGAVVAIKWLVIAFGVYVVIKNPAMAADIIKSIWSALVSIAEAIITLFDHLLGRK